MSRIRELDQTDYAVFFIFALIISGLIVIWFFISIPLGFRIVITIVLLMSLYYQFMVWYRELTIITLGNDIEDRMINEKAYQTIKRGYEFKIERIPVDEDDPYADYKIKIHTNMPEYKKKLVKLIAFYHLILTPAWNFREFEDEEDIWMDGGGY